MYVAPSGTGFKADEVVIKVPVTILENQFGFLIGRETGETPYLVIAFHEDGEPVLHLDENPDKVLEELKKEGYGTNSTENMKTALQYTFGMEVLDYHADRTTGEIHVHLSYDEYIKASLGL
jgi:hypothetical protein